jgi:hypothetical protein
MEESANTSARKERNVVGDVKMRNVNAHNGTGKEVGDRQVKVHFEDEEAKGEPVKHYDADGE